MTRDQIIDAVRAKMDEINPLAAGTTILDPQIDAQLDNAAVALVDALPSILAHPEDAGAVDAKNLIEDLSVDVVCPSDFVRLHKLKLTHWNRTVSDLLPANHPQVDLQIYRHLKATANRPVGVLSRDENGYIITCYPPPDDLLYAVEELLYVKKPANAQALDDDLIDLLAWQAAGTIYTIHRQAELAGVCYQMLTAAIEAKMKYRS